MHILECLLKGGNSCIAIFGLVGFTCSVYLIHLSKLFCTSLGTMFLLFFPVFLAQNMKTPFGKQACFCTTLVLLLKHTIK